MQVCMREVYVAMDGAEFKTKGECLAYETTQCPVVQGTMYAHGSRDSNSSQGELLGMQGEALKAFRYVLSEVKFSVEINRLTGEVKCTHVNDVALVEPMSL